MPPATWRILPVSPDLVGRIVLVEASANELVQARVESVAGYTITVSGSDYECEIDLSDGKHVYARVA